MKLVNVCPCDGWYYVGPHVDGKPIVFKIAAWGLTEDGVAHGLIAVQITEQVPARLVLPPPVGGTYKADEALSDIERASAARG